MARSEKRTEALGCILSDGLMYSWFQVEELDADACTATIQVQDPDDEDNWIEHNIGPADVARGLRLYREYLQGKREGFPGEWKYRADDAVRAGLIASADEFVGTEHAKASPDSYAWETVKFDQTNGDEGDYDANTADSVMQFATLGYTIYG